jgi:C4-dicarboxylate-specific signal transduction histidine kinase
MEVQAAISDIEKGVQRATEVVKGLRALARRSGLQLTNVDMGEAIREVLTLLRSDLNGDGVVVQLEPGSLHSQVLGDRVQLQQVLVNLIRNAVEAMSAITDRPRALRISLQPDQQGKLEIALEDTGTGLNEGTTTQIFNPLFTTKADGMGMGLAISRSIVQAHHGRLWATSNQLHGATFRFTVPLAADAAGG